MKETKQDQFLAKTFLGLEELLAKELIDLGADNVEIRNRAVAFTGDKALMYRANFWCRTAIRILKVIKTFKVKSADDVYAEVKKLNWDTLLNEKKTFSIDSVVYSDNFRHSKFVTYRTKDAIADWFMEKYGKRPSVRLDDPDVALHVHISQDVCTLSLDSSGESLHKRGYRVAQTDAPINEVLAAGMIMHTGWNGQCDLYDPMCGSGTLLIEAALIALNIAPGIYRKSFAFEKWEDFDADLFDDIYNDTSTEREFNHKIYGSDILRQAISIAEQNVKSAALKKYIELEVKPVQEAVSHSDKGMLITNPPYGERLKLSDMALYNELGQRLKHHFVNHDAWVISSSKEGLAKIGMKPSKKIRLLNADLECEFWKFEIFQGKRNDYVRERKR